MKVNQTCTGCEACLPYCPQGAISMTEEMQAAVNRDLCVECGVCIDTDICPVSAFEEDQDETAKYKRSFGRLLSKHLDLRDVVTDSPYDVKTNDVTGKIPESRVVMRLELNRPGGGLTFRDAKQMGAEMQRLGWNPDISSRSLNIDEDRLTDRALDQRILTCHLEMVLDPEKVPDAVKDASRFVT
jgi:NAD-dependent dihydropyrimidine dehydrogenase PreA subunit